MGGEEGWKGMEGRWVECGGRRTEVAVGEVACRSVRDEVDEGEERERISDRSR